MKKPLDYTVFCTSKKFWIYINACTGATDFCIPCYWLNLSLADFLEKTYLKISEINATLTLLPINDESHQKFICILITKRPGEFYAND